MNTLTVLMNTLIYLCGTMTCLWWDSPTKGRPSLCASVSAHLPVSAQLYGILDHMDSSSIHCFVSAGCQTKQDWTRLDLRVCGQSRNNISATQTLSGAQTEVYCERTSNTYRGCSPLWLKSPVLVLLSDATLHSNFSLFH